MNNNSYFNLGIGFLLLSLYLALFGLFNGQSLIYYLAFIFILLSPFFMLKDIYLDMKESLNSSYLALYFLLLFIFTYLALRYNLLEFSFMIGDASDYYWAGVSSVLNGNNIGRFLPLSDALAGVGFQIFGYTYLPYITIVVYFRLTKQNKPQILQS